MAIIRVFFTLIQENSMLHNSMKRHPQSMVNKYIDWQGTVVALSLTNFTITLLLQVFLPFFHPNSIQIMTCYSEATWEIGNNLLQHTICLSIYIHICENIPCKMTALSFPWVNIFNVLISLWMQAIRNINIPSCHIPISIRPSVV